MLESVICTFQKGGLGLCFFCVFLKKGVWYMREYARADLNYVHFAFMLVPVIRMKKRKLSKSPSNLRSQVYAGARVTDTVLSQDTVSCRKRN
jgi:hypothetical protein